MNNQDPTQGSDALDRLVMESYAMMNHAMDRGISLPSEILNTVLSLPSNPDEDGHAAPSLSEINQAHRILTHLVRPATPQGILNYDNEKASGGFWRMFGSSLLARRLSVLSIFFVLVLVALLILKDQLAFSLHLQNFLVITSMAGFGASLALLNWAQHQSTIRSLDKSSSGTIWGRWLGALLLGLLLGELVQMLQLLSSSFSSFLTDARLPQQPLAGMLIAFLVAFLFAKRRKDTQHPVSTPELGIEANLRDECHAMAAYALSSGMKVSDTVIGTLEKLKNGDETVSNQMLNEAHRSLSRTVEPAKPRTLMLLAEEERKGGAWLWLGKVPLIRHLMLAAFVFLSMFVTLSLSSYVKTGAGGILDSEGFPLLLNLLFFISSAGLGASFAALFQANQYIVNGTFDPKYEGSYWIRFFLGIIAGLLLSELIPLGEEGGAESFGKPTLAMLGGFSAALVYSMLNRMVETLEAIFSPDKEIIDATRREAELEMKEQLHAVRLKATKHYMTTKGMVLQQSDPEAIVEFLDASADSLLPDGYEDV